MKIRYFHFPKTNKVGIAACHVTNTYDKCDAKELFGIEGTEINRSKFVSLLLPSYRSDRSTVALLPII